LLQNGPQFHRKTAKNKGKEAEMRAFLLITVVFLCLAYMVGILPGGIQ
jgi:hypothetical protein